MVHWLWYYAGLSSGSSPWYLFWSGFGADWTRLLSVFALLHIGNRLAKHHKARIAQAERHHKESMERE